MLNQLLNYVNDKGQDQVNILKRYLNLIYRHADGLKIT